MRINTALLSLLLMLGFAPRVHAWDDFGHMQVAAVAFDKLSARAKARASRLLKLNPTYANWIVGRRETCGLRAGEARRIRPGAPAKHGE